VVDEQGCKWTYLSEDAIKCGHVSGAIGEDGTENRIDERETWFGKQNESKRWCIASHICANIEAIRRRRVWESN
jgi:hypothetical protein